MRTDAYRWASSKYAQGLYSAKEIADDGDYYQTGMMSMIPGSDGCPLDPLSWKSLGDQNLLQREVLY